MDFFCEFSDSFLFFKVEFALVRAVSVYIISELAAAEVVQDHAFFARIDDFAVVSRREFFGELGFGGEFFEDCEHLFVNLLCRVVVGKTRAHRNAVVFYTVGCRACRESRLDADCAFERLKFFVRRKFVKIFPSDSHNCLFL